MSFQTYIFRWYADHGRHQLPWRHTADPYHILVSEMMLQQTQVERVIPKYQAFLAEFSTIEVLASSSLSQVLTHWQGLGYNRRAKYLHQTAVHITTHMDGRFPTTSPELETLPGIGPYTAGAICVFAYNQPVILIETNIRAVVLHHFFPHQTNVSDKQLMSVLAAHLPSANPSEWYAGLMDYGSHLKKVLPNPSRRSRQHSLQSPFHGSIRQTRGEIIRALTHQPLLLKQLQSKAGTNPHHLTSAIAQLLQEGLITQQGQRFSLPQ